MRVSFAFLLIPLFALPASAAPLTDPEISAIKARYPAELACGAD